MSHLQLCQSLSLNTQEKRLFCLPHRRCHVPHKHDGHPPHVTTEFARFLPVVTPENLRSFPWTHTNKRCAFPPPPTRHHPTSTHDANHHRIGMLVQPTKAAATADAQCTPTLVQTTRTCKFSSWIVGFQRTRAKSLQLFAACCWNRACHRTNRDFVCRSCFEGRSSRWLQGWPQDGSRPSARRGGRTTLL